MNEKSANTLLATFTEKYGKRLKITSNKFHHPTFSGVILDNLIKIHCKGRTCYVTLEEFEGLYKLFCNSKPYKGA